MHFCTEGADGQLMTNRFRILLLFALSSAFVFAVLVGCASPDSNGETNPVEVEEANQSAGFLDSFGCDDQLLKDEIMQLSQNNESTPFRIELLKIYEGEETLRTEDRLECVAQAKLSTAEDSPVRYWIEIDDDDDVFVGYRIVDELTNSPTGGNTPIGSSTLEATSTPEPTPLPGYGPGILAVGRDIEPGIYAGKVGLGVFDSCYWARLKGVSGDFDDIITNDNAIGQFYISVSDSDEYLEVTCRITPLADWPEPEEPPQSIAPGIHLVGRDIAPGTYQGEAGTGVLDSCYWGRLSGLSGGFDDIIANGNAAGAFYVSVLPTDTGLSTHCSLELVRE